MKISTRSWTLALGLLIFPRTAAAWAPDPWTFADTCWEMGFAAVVAMDCAQSEQLDFLGRYERNPLLPRHPDRKTVRLICLGSITGHAAISFCLPVGWRRGWQGVTIFLEAATVTDNYYRAGLRVRF